MAGMLKKIGIALVGFICGVIFVFWLDATFEDEIDYG